MGGSRWWFAGVVCCIIVVGAYGTSQTHQRKQKPALTSTVHKEAREFCDSLRHSGSPLLPVRCKEPNEDLARYGKSYIQRQHSNDKSNITLEPVILLPGIAGSAFEAQLHKNDSPAWYCFENWDWFRLWFSLEELLVQPCWMQNLRLQYNANNNTYEDAPGVETRTIDFGGVNGIDYLDYVFGLPVSLTTYYAVMIQSFVEVGYKPGKNLRGAPYDWRTPPTNPTFMYPALKTLVEETYTINNNQKVHIVTHSMGGVVFTYFLNNYVSVEWKETYIASFIPIAAPWAGSSKALRSLVSGENFDIEVWGFELANKLEFRNVARTAGGLIMLVPDVTFWGLDEVFVYTPKRNYTVADLPALFADMNSPVTNDIYKHVWKIVPDIQPPGVPTYCLYGIEYPTQLSYRYADGNFDNDPEVLEYVSGDGTVPEKSLAECTSWADHQKPPVLSHKFSMREHQSILQDEEVIHFILDLITK